MLSAFPDDWACTFIINSYTIYQENGFVTGNASNVYSIHMMFPSGILTIPVTMAFPFVSKNQTTMRSYLCPTEGGSSVSSSYKFLFMFLSSLLRSISVPDVFCQCDAHVSGKRES